MDTEKKGTNYRISWTLGLILSAVAFVGDIVSLIPFVGDFVGPIYWVLAGGYLWKARGVNPIKGKNVAGKVAAISISLVAKLIPVVQELPIELFAGMIALVIVTRLEDKTGIDASALASGNIKAAVVGGVRSSVGRPPPLNEEDNVRRPRAAAPDRATMQDDENMAVAMDSVRAPSGGLN